MSIIILQQIITWCATLVILLTSVAMLSDMRYQCSFKQAYFKFIEIIKFKICKKELVIILRFILKSFTLTLIMASSGVGVLMPHESQLQAFEVLLRLGLALFMVISSPCPWWRFVFIGNNRSKKGEIL